MDATGDIEFSEYDAINKELFEDLFCRSESLDPFQTKQKIPRTPDSAGSNRSRPLTGDAPLPTRSVSPPVPKPSSRGQDNVRCFQDCLKPCRSMKKRHFHCKICDYISERLDNMKRHIPYHFLKTKKERQRAPDGVKMVCHEYFTEDCHVDSCSYRQKNYPHFHCKICKSWACNHKKSYKYRLKHLNSSHYLFFMEKDNCEESLYDPVIDKKIKNLKQPDQAKILSYPAAEEQVLNSRRRAKCKARNLETVRLADNAKLGDVDSRDLTIDYLENAGNDVKSILQSVGMTDDNVPGGDVKEHRINHCKESDEDGLEPLLGVENGGIDSSSSENGDASTYSVTLNGDLGTILQIILSLKRSGIVLEDPSLQNVIRKHPASVLQQLSLLVQNNNNSLESFYSKVADPIKEVTEIYGSNDGLSDDGFSESLELSTFDLEDPSHVVTEDYELPLKSKTGNFPVIEPQNLLEFLTKIIVDGDTKLLDETQKSNYDSNSEIDVNRKRKAENAEVENVAAGDISNSITGEEQNVSKEISDESSIQAKKHKYETRSSRLLTREKNSLRDSKQKQATFRAKKMQEKGHWNVRTKIVMESTEVVDSSEASSNEGTAL